MKRLLGTLALVLLAVMLLSACSDLGKRSASGVTKATEASHNLTTEDKNASNGTGAVNGRDLFDDSKGGDSTGAFTQNGTISGGKGTEQTGAPPSANDKHGNASTTARNPSATSATNSTGGQTGKTTGSARSGSSDPTSPIGRDLDGDGWIDDWFHP